MPKENEELNPIYKNCAVCGVNYNTRDGGMIKGKMVCMNCYERSRGKSEREKIIDEIKGMRLGVEGDYDTIQMVRFEIIKQLKNKDV